MDQGCGELREEGAGEAGVGAGGRFFPAVAAPSPVGVETRFRVPPRLRDTLSRATAVAGHAFAWILDLQKTLKMMDNDSIE